MDPATLAIGATIGGGVGTLAALVVFGLIFRFVYHTWQEFDNLRTVALEEMRKENTDLRRRVEALELKVPRM